MRALLAIAALLSLQACAQSDDEAFGKSTQASTAPVENAALDNVGDAPVNGA